MSSKTLLIFGGIRPIGRAIVMEALREGTYDRIRVVDMKLPANEFIPEEELRWLKRTEVLHMNVGAGVEDQSVIELAFRTEKGYSWDVVVNAYFDMNHIADATLHETNTVVPARRIGQAALEYDCGVVIHLTPMYMAYWKNKMATIKDDSEIHAWPNVAQSVAFIKAEKEIRSIEGLPLVVLRCADVYGLGATGGTATVCRSIRIHLENEKKSHAVIFNKDDYFSTIHLHDVGRAVLHASRWYVEQMQRGPRIFTLADEGDTTFQMITVICCEVLGIVHQQKSWILREIVYLLFKLDSFAQQFTDNDTRDWVAVLARANVPACPIVGNLRSEATRTRWMLRVDGSSFREETGFSLMFPHYTHETVQGALQYWRNMKVWPEYVPERG